MNSDQRSLALLTGLAITATVTTQTSSLRRSQTCNRGTSPQPSRSVSVPGGRCRTWDIANGAWVAESAPWAAAYPTLQDMLAFFGVEGTSGDAREIALIENVRALTLTSFVRIAGCANASDPWVWRPHACDLDPWESDEFCRRLAGGLLLVGDSMTKLMFMSIVAILLAAPPTAGLPVTSSNKSTLVEVGSVRIAFLQAGELASHLEAHPEYLTHYGVVVYNEGLHYRTPQAGLVDHVHATAALIESHTFPNTTLLWRDTPVGHYGCSHPGLMRSRPFATRTEAEAWLKRYPGDPRYGWPHIAQENGAIAACVFPTTSRWRSLSAYTPLMTRPDRHPGNQTWDYSALARISMRRKNPEVHIDCVHYCLPGPTDTLVHLLYHALGDDDIR